MQSLCKISTDFVAPKIQMFRSERFLRRKPPHQGKPPILPPSKKRLYQFRQPEWQSPEDVRELLWRRHVYNNVVLSMRREFREEIDRDTREALNTVEDIKRREGEELNRLLAENEAKNRKKAAERAEREQVEAEALTQISLKELEEKLSLEEAEIRKREKEVVEMIERSKEFVTRENLEQKVLDALENPVVLDYAVDLDGKRYQSARPPVKYIEGTLVPRQKGRAYDLSHGGLPGGLQKQQHKKQPPGFNSSRRKGAIV